jgi:hypothetical protein
MQWLQPSLRGARLLEQVRAAQVRQEWGGDGFPQPQRMVKPKRTIIFDDLDADFPRFKTFLKNNRVVVVCDERVAPHNGAIPVAKSKNQRHVEILCWLVFDFLAFFVMC